jgi:hypothetical protein
VNINDFNAYNQYTQQTANVPLQIKPEYTEDNTPNEIYTTNMDIIICGDFGGDIDKIKFLTDIYIIGEIVPAEDGVTLHTKGGNRHAITAQGWTHFSS